MRLAVFLLLLSGLSACGGEHAPPIVVVAPSAPTSSPSDKSSPPSPSSSNTENGNHAGPPIVGGNVPPTTVLTFATIKSQIFQKSCLSCHAAGGHVAGVPLETLEDLINSPRDLVIPGNPDESGLFIAVSRTDSKRMPPPGSGYQSLSADEIALIRRWIAEGARQ